MSLESRIGRRFRHVGLLTAPLLALTLAACQPADHHGANIPGDRADGRPFAGIAPNETVHVTGTEPFWSGEVAGTTLLYKTVDQPEGRSFVVSRFAGRGGLSFSGAIDGRAMTMAVTPGACSDGMSDRSFPFVVTLALGDETRNGCGWSDAHPYRGPAAP